MLLNKTVHVEKSKQMAIDMWDQNGISFEATDLTDYSSAFSILTMEKNVLPVYSTFYKSVAYLDIPGPPLISACEVSLLSTVFSSPIPNCYRRSTFTLQLMS